MKLHTKTVVASKNTAAIPEKRILTITHTPQPWLVKLAQKFKLNLEPYEIRYEGELYGYDKWCMYKPYPKALTPLQSGRIDEQYKLVKRQQEADEAPLIKQLRTIKS